MRIANDVQRGFTNPPYLAASTSLPIVLLSSNPDIAILAQPVKSIEIIVMLNSFMDENRENRDGKIGDVTRLI